MSDTPKTDANCFALVSNDPKSVVVWANFARELERENAALREDKERLDWLEAGGEPETYEDAPHALVWCVFGETGQRSIRAAFDAARAKEAKP